MPSQIAHSQFSADILITLQRRELLGAAPAWLAFGSQGPDMFYHNQRRKPSGIALGSLLHRRGYGSFCATMVARAIDSGVTPDAPLGQYILGFITHAILDRHLHPFINYHSGWFEPKQPESKNYRYAHAFFERIIDMYSFRGDLIARGLASDPSSRIFPGLHQPGGSDSNFGTLSDLGNTIPKDLEELLTTSLYEVFPKTREDQRLSQRLANAYQDARGFYQFCDRAEQERWQHWNTNLLEPITSLRWTGLLHPLAIPDDLDPLNLSGRTWQDPCGIGDEHSLSLPELWDRAVDHGVDIIGTVLRLWEHREIPQNFEGLAPLIGDSDLRNTFSDIHLCTLTESDPLPLRSVLQTLSSGNIPDSWQSLV